MRFKAVLFDLDGTLLPMDQELFIKSYFGALVKMLVKLGYDAEKTSRALLMSVKAMQENDGKRTNENVFWDTFAANLDENIKDLMPAFESFYANDFDKIKSVSSYNEKSARIVKALREKGISVVLATQPMFPVEATYRRISWAGLSPNDFELVTTYENSRYSKPNLNYYNDILEKIGIDASQCLMVGNDVNDDMVAENMSIKVFLLCDCLINTDSVDISKYPNGTFEDLAKYIEIDF